MSLITTKDGTGSTTRTGALAVRLSCVKEFSEVDYTDDLEKIDVPTLIIHGDDDQIVPIGNAGLKSAKIVRNATLKVYPGSAHGLCDIDAHKVNADLLGFITS